jgi:type 1 fimbria pilin
MAVASALPAAVPLKHSFGDMLMKLRHSLLATTLLAALSSTAMAQRSADLTVIGTIVPGSCTLTLSNGGNVDLGQIDLAQLDPLVATALPAQNVAVSIACAAPMRFATTATENRPGTASATGDSFFGLGETSAGNPIGFYELRVASPTADGVAANAIASANATAWTVPAGGVKVEHGTGNTLTAVRTGASGGPSILTTATWNLQVHPTIAPSDSLALTASEYIDGSMTLDIVYL